MINMYRGVVNAKEVKQATFDAASYPSRMYIYRIATGYENKFGKLILKE